jgi:hypothetical protein
MRMCLKFTFVDPLEVAICIYSGMYIGGYADENVPAYGQRDCDPGFVLPE